MCVVDLSNFLSTLAGNFEGVVQYNRDNRAFEGAVDTNVTIPVLCNLMDDTTIDPLQRSVRFVCLVGTHDLSLTLSDGFVVLCCAVLC